MRSVCRRCGQTVWIFKHVGGHYRWGYEVIDCDCLSAKVNSREWQEQLRKKKAARKYREEGYIPSAKYRPITTPEMARKAAEGIAMGMKPSQAKRMAGFPETSCRVHNQMGQLNKMIRAELKTMSRKYIQLGRDLSPEEQEAMVRGRLAENTILGTDKGVLSAKQLGADKRVAMWQPDSQVGMVVIQAPPVPKIDHEVPLVPSREERLKLAAGPKP